MRASPVLLAVAAAATLVNVAAGSDVLTVAAGLALAIYLGVEWPTLHGVGKVMIAVSVVLVVAITVDAGSAGVLLTGVERGCLLATFITALGFMRTAATSSRSIRRLGAYLTQQPPGRRYLALALGGQLVAALMHVGSLPLLLSMVKARYRGSSPADPEPADRRERRMTLAVLRGVSGVVLWSPLTIAMALVLSVMPNVTWQGLLPYGLASAVTFLVVGWSLDRGSVDRRANRERSGGARIPLASLAELLALVGAVLVLSLSVLRAFDVHLVVAVMYVVPGAAACWIAASCGRFGAVRSMRLTARRIGRSVRTEFPDYRSEIAILASASLLSACVLSVVPASLFADHVVATPFRLHVLAAAIPVLVTGAASIGISPLVTASVLAAVIGQWPLQPDETSLLAMALLWGFTVTTGFAPISMPVLIVSRLTGRSSIHVGVRWNGIFSLASLSAFAVLVALHGAVLGR